MNPFPASRRVCKCIRAGRIRVGGDAPVSVQTMTCTDTRDAVATLAQITSVAAAGCDLVRVAVPDMAAIDVLARICADAPIPVIADVHFDYRLAVAAVEQGVACVRINPGNIGGTRRLKAVVDAARANAVSIRVGVNSGSLEKDLEERYGSGDARALAESALRHVHALESLGFDEIKLSVKASDVARTVLAYRMVASACDYPLHLGVTEAGTLQTGTVRSAVGIGILLGEGIGDTIRVSLTDTPEREVEVGLELLRCLGLREAGPSVISCPTCGRCEVDVAGMAQRVEAKLRLLYAERHGRAFPSVAIMGCMVNGPGEARHADLALAGGKGKFGVYRQGECIGIFPEDGAQEVLLRLVVEWLDDA